MNTTTIDKIIIEQLTLINEDLKSDKLRLLQTNVKNFKHLLKTVYNRFQIDLSKVTDKEVVKLDSDAAAKKPYGDHGWIVFFIKEYTGTNGKIWKELIGAMLDGKVVNKQLKISDNWRDFAGEIGDWSWKHGRNKKNAALYSDYAIAINYVFQQGKNPTIHTVNERYKQKKGSPWFMFEKAIKPEMIKLKGYLKTKMDSGDHTHYTDKGYVPYEKYSEIEPGKLKDPDPFRNTATINKARYKNALSKKIDPTTIWNDLKEIGLKLSDIHKDFYMNLDVNKVVANTNSEYYRESFEDNLYNALSYLKSSVSNYMDMYNRYLKGRATSMDVLDVKKVIEGYKMTINDYIERYNKAKMKLS